MSWRSLSFKNMLGNARQYVGYLASSSLAVTVFFMFACFTLNPASKEGYVSRTAAAILVACQYIVILFAVFFVFFFHAALIRLRSREFGLLNVLGMTPRQVARSVFAESLLLGAAALVIGGAVGLVLTRLFLMTMGLVLGLESRIPFMVPSRAVLYTLILFGAVFVVEGLAIAFRVRRSTPRLLLVVQRTRQRAPRASWVLAVLGLACLASAYWLAVARSHAIVMLAIPIIGLTTVGTFLLFSQVLVITLARLRKRHLPGGAMLVVGRLAHRIRDNASTLTVVTVLTAMVLTGLGGVLGQGRIIEQDAVRAAPFAIMMAHNDAGEGGPGPDDVRAALARDGVKVTGEAQTRAIEGVLWEPARSTAPATESPGERWSSDVWIFSASGFASLRDELYAREPGLRRFLPPVSAPRPGHVSLVAPFPYTVMAQRMFSGHDHLSFTVGDQEMTVTLDGVRDMPQVVDGSLASMPDMYLVVPDGDFARLQAMAPPDRRWTLHGWITPAWKATRGAVERLEGQHVLQHDERGGLIVSRVQRAGSGLQLYSTMLFGGMFLSVLFLLACASAILFRIQAGEEEDRRQFAALRRLGVSAHELSGVVGWEYALMFFVPLALAALHSTVAIVSYTTLLEGRFLGTPWPTFAVVVLAYTAAITVFYLTARARYVRSLVGTA